ncbi:MAG: T9SS type A sorting domain-containing protein [Candidatus Pacearchaeota archaeon]
MLKYSIILFIITINIYAQVVPRGQKIINGEYFFNKDPGEGKGFPIVTTYNQNNVNVDFTVQMQPGDILYLRFKSSNGLWSQPQTVFGKFSSSSGATLITAEYFINKDPGIGKGIPITINSQRDIVISNLNIQKNDNVFIRVKDSYNRWSEPKAIKYNFKKIIAAEYYIKYNNSIKTSISPMTIINLPPNSHTFITTSGNLFPLLPNDSVFVRVQDEEYLWSEWYGTTNLATKIDEEFIELPKIFSLFQNFPNPFNPLTKIKFSIPKTSFVNIIVYDILGREITTLINEEKLPGIYEVEFNATNLPSGIYFCRMLSDKYSETKKMILLK